MSVIIDFLLDILVKVFEKLKKKSNSTYWRNMVLVNSLKLKQELLMEIVQQLQDLKVEIPEELKNKLEKGDEENEQQENNNTNS